MYIQDSTLASAFDNAAAEYIEQTEAELLAEYKSISNIAIFHAFAICVNY